jgi:hypothetical protein
MNMMHTIFALVLLVSPLFHSHAAEVNKTLVLVKSRTVLFAQPEYRGTSKLQVFDDGSFEWVDNKNRVTEIGNLSKGMISKLIQKSEVITQENLRIPNPDAPRCADAPIEKTIVYNLKNSTSGVTIWKREDCLSYEPNQSEAMELTQVIRGLELTYSGLK